LEHYHSAQARPQLREKDGRVVHAGAAICEVAELRQVFEAGLCDEVAAERRKQAPPQRRQDQEQERNEAAAEKLARARVPEEDRLDGSRPGKGDQEGRPEQRPNGERARDPDCARSSLLRSASSAFSCVEWDPLKSASSFSAVTFCSGVQQR